MNTSHIVDGFKRFASYMWGTLVHPRSTFQQLVTDPAALMFGTVAILLVGTLYTVATIIGYLNGFGACTLPWLPFDPKEYYYYMAFFTIPAFWLTTLVYCAVAQYFSTFANGKGSFAQCVAIAGFGLQVTMIPLMLIPEMIYFIFSIHSPIPSLELCGTLGLGVVMDNIRLFIAVLWQLVVVTIGLRVIHQFSSRKAILISLIAFSIYELVFWTYIR